MSLVTKVKAANITNLSDARYCAGMGVDWIGFPVSEINPVRFTEITGWLSGPQWVIELDKQPWPAPADYPVTLWQCSLQDLELTQQFPGNMMVAMDVQQWEHAEILHVNRHRIEAIVISGYSNNNDVDRNTIAAISKLFPVLIDVSTIPYSLSEILTWNITGINVHGTSEQRPGLKDYAQLADVLEKLEAE